MWTIIYKKQQKNHGIVRVVHKQNKKYAIVHKTQEKDKDKRIQRQHKDKIINVVQFKTQQKLQAVHHNRRK